MGGFRRFIIKTAEVMMFIFVIGFTLLMAIGGAIVGKDNGAVAILLFLLCGVIGFVIAAGMAAIFFILAEIAENTRKEVLIQEGARPHV